MPMIQAWPSRRIVEVLEVGKRHALDIETLVQREADGLGAVVGARFLPRLLDAARDLRVVEVDRAPAGCPA